MLLVHHGDRVFGHHGWWWFFGGLVPFLFLLVLIGVAIWAILRATGRVPARVEAAIPVARADGALSEVRLRYARGEMSREEFLQRSRDLGAERSPGEFPPDAGSG